MLGLSCQGRVTVGGAASLGVEGCGHLEHGRVVPAVGALQGWTIQLAC